MHGWFLWVWVLCMVEGRTFVLLIGILQQMNTAEMLDMAVRHIEDLQSQVQIIIYSWSSPDIKTMVIATYLHTSHVWRWSYWLARINFKMPCPFYSNCNWHGFRAACDHARPEVGYTKLLLLGRSSQLGCWICKCQSPSYFRYKAKNYANVKHVSKLSPYPAQGGLCSSVVSSFSPCAYRIGGLLGVTSTNPEQGLWISM